MVWTSAIYGIAGLVAKKKPTWLSTLGVLDHVGLLVNGLPGTAGLPFI
jgi:hypothetical protein